MYLNQSIDIVKAVEVEKPVYINRTVEVEKVVEKLVEKIIYVNQSVPVEIEKIVYINRTVEVEKIVEVYVPWEEYRTSKLNASWGKQTYKHCALDFTLKELRQRRKNMLPPRFKTGGLGKLMQPDVFEVWACVKCIVCPLLRILVCNDLTIPYIGVDVRGRP